MNDRTAAELSLLGIYMRSDCKLHQLSSKLDITFSEGFYRISLSASYFLCFFVSNWGIRYPMYVRLYLFKQKNNFNIFSYLLFYFWCFLICVFMLSDHVCWTFKKECLRFEKRAFSSLCILYLPLSLPALIS